MTPKWRPILLSTGELDGRLRASIEHASGAYAIREASSHRVVYVGESHRGRMWKTMLRHFQAPESFRKVRETGVFASSPARYEIAVWITSSGKRSRASSSSSDQKAMKAQADWIALLDPTRNKDDGFVYEPPGEADEDPWGGLLKNPRGSLKDLRSGDLDGDEHRKLAQSLLKAADSEYDRNVRKKGEDPAAADARREKKRAEIFAARDAGDVARKARYEREISEIDQRIKESRPRPGSIEHEIALRKGRNPSFPPSAGPWHDVRFSNATDAKRFAKGVKDVLGYQAVVDETIPSLVTTNASREEIHSVLDRLDDKGRGGKRRIMIEGMTKRNPSRAAVVVELGKLTEIVWSGGKQRWSLKDAPSIVVEKGKIVIVYAPKSSGRASSIVAKDEYAKLHWGEGVTHERMRAGVAPSGPFVELGAGVSVTYATQKGSQEMADWIHVWGEGAKGAWSPPKVLRQKSGGGLALKGGTYRVTERGIVG